MNILYQIGYQISTNVLFQTNARITFGYAWSCRFSLVSLPPRVISICKQK